MYAGLALTTPTALCPIEQAVTSFSPPMETTVPTSYSASARYFSARSAYLAAVAVPLKILAVIFADASLAAIL